MEVSYPTLVWHASRSEQEDQYHCFEIPKRSGEPRQITAPITAIKIIQTKLNWLLQLVHQPRNSTFGFVPCRNVVKNAAKHRRQRYVFNLDLKSFFPSINFGRVRGLFLAEPFNLAPEVATTLARLACHKNSLSQGAPSSPVISNMICWKMDKDLQILASKNSAVYTRYADDITFSTSIPEFPTDICKYDDSVGKYTVGSALLSLIEGNGFKVNERKVRLQWSRSRQEVTGLIVNTRVNVKRSFISELRAMLHDWQRNDLKAAEQNFRNHYVKNRHSSKPPPLFRDVVRGKLGYLAMVRGKEDRLYLHYLEKFNRLNRRPR